MQIHELKKTKRQSRKRVGRGGKRGTYSGAGMKGQKSRSGGNVDPLFEGGRSSLIQRMKKNRGFKAVHAKKNPVNLAMLSKVFGDGETVSVATLIEKRVLNKKAAKDGVTIVASGELTVKVTIDAGIDTTQGAQKAVEKAGGSVTKSDPTTAEKSEKTKKTTQDKK